MSATLDCRCSLLAIILLPGCTLAPHQSTLHPAGPAASEIAMLWWVMFGTFTAVFVLVLILLFIAIFRRSDLVTSPGVDNDVNRNMVHSAKRNRFIVGGGVVLPVVVLTPLFLLSLRTSASLRTPPEALTIRVVGHMWWWEVRYPERGIVTANEIYVPAGQPVRLEMTSVDVIHSFWVPRLNGKRDMIPGIETVFWIQADKPGVYRGLCAEYCGTQHAYMAFQLVALPEDEFEAWLNERRQPRATLPSGDEEHGFQVFMKAGCAQCHTIRNTPAKGNVGPDLTHVGSRRTLGAAVLPNTRGNLAGWIANPQAIKPGVKMPRSYLPADDLMDLVTFLERLE